MNERFPLVIANHKANKTWAEVESWLEEIGPKANNFIGVIVFCPSDPFLASSAMLIKTGNWNLSLGSQNISQFEKGNFTGEVAASQIADLVRYSIIGHSERREYLRESDDSLAQKVQNALSAQIEPIFCIQGPNTNIPDGVKIVAYEPKSAIGTGNADTPQNVKKVASQIKERGNYTILYGGSVSAENAASFIQKGLVDGVLVGATNSLNPQSFSAILKALV
ncbi:MAG: triose-phosphate isomerase family protein [Patescibacteria group bacterium]